MYKNRIRPLQRVVVVIFLLMTTQALAAYPSRFEIITFEPTIDGGDYYTVYGSQNLGAWQGHLGIYFDYANRPLQFFGTGVVAGQRQSVVENLIIADIIGGIGFTDWFELGFNLPTVLYNFFRNDTTNLEDNGGGLGDMQVVGKFRIVNTENSPVGFAIAPFIALPSGDPIRYTGNGNLTGGINLITDFMIHRKFTMALNLGATFRDDVTRQGVRIDDQFDYGLAGALKWTENFHSILEVFGATNIRNFFNASSHSPMEIGAGIRYLFGDSGFGANLGGTLGVIDGVGASRFGVFSGLTWSAPVRTCEACPPPAPPPDPRIQDGKIRIWGKIYFDTDKTIIKPISYPILDDVVDVMKKNPGIGLVEIQGHCDIRGSDAYNMNLSQGRAESVREYLVSKGVEAGRLNAVGYGFRKPIADNESKEGMSQNRRVEFVILQGS